MSVIPEKDEINNIKSDEYIIEEDPKRELVASIILGMLMSGIIIYVVYLSFNWIALAGSFVLIGLVLAINPSIIDHLIKESAIQYYCIFFAITLLFSIEHCKNDKNMIMLILVGVLVSMLSFYIKRRWMTIISMTYNFYVVLKILLIFIQNANCQ